MTPVTSAVLDKAAAAPLWKRRLMLAAFVGFFAALALPMLPLIGLMLLGPNRFEASLFRTAVALDQLANAIAGGNEDETISSRVGKRLYFAFQNGTRPKLFDRIVRRFTDCIEPGHVFIWIEPDRGMPVTEEQRADAIDLARNRLI